MIFNLREGGDERDLSVLLQLSSKDRVSAARRGYEVAPTYEDVDPNDDVKVRRVRTICVNLYFVTTPSACRWAATFALRLDPQGYLRDPMRVSIKASCYCRVSELRVAPAAIDPQHLVYFSCCLIRQCAVVRDNRRGNVHDCALYDSQRQRWRRTRYN